MGLDFFSALAISGSGLSAERARVNAASANLANAETTRGPNGQPYHRIDPVFQSTSFSAFLGAEMQLGNGPVMPQMDSTLVALFPLGMPAMPMPGVNLPGGAGALGVRVAELDEDETPGRRVYNPGHPDADEDGFVTMPNVNPIHEVANLVSAQGAYDANASAIETLKTMANKALDI